MSKKKVATGPKAYSYIRFSTPEQAMGDSERRQLDGAQKFAEREGLTLDDSLKMVDRGLSGYSGKNLKKGALGLFLEQIKAGKVASGSMLIVENVDRLSRQGFMDAFKVITDIISAGVIIQTLSPEARYDRAALNGGQIYGLVAQMQMAHEESKKKSERLSAAWKSKRAQIESGKLLTGLVPDWIEVDEDSKGTRRLMANKDAARTLRQIFKWRSEGVGIRQIVMSLNEGNCWKPPGRKRTPPGQQKVAQPPAGTRNDWRRSYVNKILVNRSVLGEIQPHRMVNGKRQPDGDPIKGYFPQIVTPGLFEKVQKTLSRGKGGRTGTFDNVLRYLCQCAYCGGSMTLINKGELPKGGKYLACETGTRSDKCERNQFRYDQIENLILDNCPKLDPSMVVPSSDEITERCQGLRESIDEVNAKLSDVSQQIENLVDQIGRTKSVTLRDRLEVKFNEVDAEQKDLQKQVESLTTELDHASKGLEQWNQWQSGMETLRTKIRDAKEGPMFRQKLNQHLRDLITKVEVFSRGYPRLSSGDDSRRHFKAVHPDSKKKGKKRLMAVVDRTPPKTDDIVQYVEAVLDEAEVKIDREMKDFIDDLAARRMTREGRFIRIHFQSGQWVDLVPPGGLATGHVLTQEGFVNRWAYRALNLDELLTEFLANRKKKAPKRIPKR